MILEQGIKVYNPLLEKALAYVNRGWRMDYKLEDIAGLEISTTFIFLHFNKEDYSKEAYPISIEILFKQGQSTI